MKKKAIHDLSLFGGPPIFDNVRSTSNLVRPEIENFLSYSHKIYEDHKTTNNGSLVQTLEYRLARLHQTKYCVTFCSGFMALMVTINFLAKKGKKEVIIPSLTYRRMADIIAWCGLVPYFCEVDKKTLAKGSCSLKRADRGFSALS